MKSVTERVDFDELRNQRDCVLSLLNKADKANAVYINNKEANALNGIVNLFDSLLDEKEGYPVI